MNKNIDALSAERALKLALEALEQHGCPWIRHEKPYNEAITAIREALAHAPTEREQPAQQQEPVLWQILNGVCHAGVRSTENLAKEAAANMQKTHDLAGSLAAFHVRPLYGQLPANANAGKPWVGLTQGECEFLAELQNASPTAIVRLTEAKLREKNT